MAEGDLNTIRNVREGWQLCMIASLQYLLRGIMPVRDDGLHGSISFLQHLKITQTRLPTRPAVPFSYSVDPVLFASTLALFRGCLFPIKHPDTSTLQHGVSNIRPGLV